MRAVLLLTAVVLLITSLPRASSKTANATHFTVGTVLFLPTDAQKQCWTPESAALLTTRMLMRNAMPNVNSLRATDNKFIDDVIDYFRLMLEVIRSSTNGRIKHIMLLAFADTLGGYMKHLILPISKYSYYAGTIEYASIIKLYQLYDELKNFLNTNGNGWAKAWKKAGHHVQAKAIALAAPVGNIDPCKGIIYYKHPSGKGGSDATKTCSIEVPLPFFDSKSNPTAIAVPFKTFGLRNLESRVSAYILVKFYVAVSKCMAARNSAEDDIEKFNNNMNSFIMGKVMPHLCDERFYAAFGGVLRILETIKTLGHKNGKYIGSFNIMPEVEEKEPFGDQQGGDEGEDKSNAGVGASSEPEEGKKSKNSVILMAALVTIIIWFCLGAAFVCCRVRASKMKKDENMKALQGSEPKSDVEMCEENTCPAYQDSSSHTGSSQKQSKTNSQIYKSPGSSQRTMQEEQEQEQEPAVQPSDPSTTKSTHSTVSVESEPEKSEPNADVATDAPQEPEIDSRRLSQPYRVHSMQYYPPRFACHTSIGGHTKLDSSTEEVTSREDTKRPYVFGYDFHTSSEESSSRETTDGENEMGGNMSK